MHPYSPPPLWPSDWIWMVPFVPWVTLGKVSESMQKSPRPVARKVRRTTVLKAEPGLLPWAKRTSTLVVV